MYDGKIILTILWNTYVFVSQMAVIEVLQWVTVFSIPASAIMYISYQGLTVTLSKCFPVQLTSCVFQLTNYFSSIRRLNHKWTFIWLPVANANDRSCQNHSRACRLTMHVSETARIVAKQCKKLCSRGRYAYGKFHAWIGSWTRISKTLLVAILTISKVHVLFILQNNTRRVFLSDTRQAHCKIVLVIARQFEIFENGEHVEVVHEILS